MGTISVSLWYGSSEAEKNGGGARVSVGVRYLLLMPCASPQAAADINGGQGKSVMSYAPDLPPLTHSKAQGSPSHIVQMIKL